MPMDYLPKDRAARLPCEELRPKSFVVRITRSPRSWQHCCMWWLIYTRFLGHFQVSNLDLPHQFHRYWALSHPGNSGSGYLSSPPPLPLTKSPIQEHIQTLRQGGRGLRDPSMDANLLASFLGRDFLGHERNILIQSFLSRNWKPLDLKAVIKPV